MASSVVLALSLPSMAGAQNIFGPQSVGTTSSQVVTVDILNSATANDLTVLAQLAPNLDFTNAGGGTCAVGKAYTMGSTCTVNVNFAPKFAGTRYGAVVLSSASGVMGTAYLQGTGNAPQTIFLPGVQTAVGGHFGEPEGVAVDGSGNFYVTSGSSVYKETPGSGGYAQTTIGTGFVAPIGVAVDGAGNVYVADRGNQAVYLETLVNGQYIQSTVASGLGSPQGVAVDGGGNVYVADLKLKSVSKYSFAAGDYSQSAVGSGYSQPVGVAVDGSGNVYVADEGNNALYKEKLASGVYTQTTIGNGYSFPSGVAVDGLGNVYIAALDNGFIYKETLTGANYAQSTLGGFAEPQAVAVDGSGNLYVADFDNSAVYKLDVADPPSLSFATTKPDATSSDSPQSVMVANLGNEILGFSSIGYPADFPHASGVMTDCTAMTSLAQGADCTLTIDFSPTGSGLTTASLALSENVTVTTDTLNAAGTGQDVAVSGTETTYNFLVGLTAQANPGTVGIPVTFTATVTGVGAAAGVTPTGSATFYSGANSLGSATLSNGVATFSSSFATAGSYSITAKYDGYGIFPGAPSNVFTENVYAVFGDASIGALEVGTTSSPIAVKATFSSIQVLDSISVVTQGIPDLDFLNAGGGTCTANTAYGPGDTCTVMVTFTPKYAGPRYGAVVLANPSGEVIATGYLEGIGQAPQTIFLPAVQRTIGSGFDSPTGVAVDAGGDLYVVDRYNSALYKETLASGQYTQSTIENTLSSLNNVAVDGSGSLYVTESTGSYTGAVFEETLANGQYTQTMIGSGFNHPAGIAVDGSGNVYIADGGTGTVYKETLANGQYTQSVVAMGLNQLTGLALDGSGNVYVANIGEPSSVFKETLANGQYTQSTVATNLLEPIGVAVDAGGNVYVSDAYAATVYKEAPANGTYTQSKIGSGFTSPGGLAVDQAGNVYVADVSAVAIYDLQFGSPTTLSFASTQAGATSTDSPQTVTVSNLGNETLAFSAVSFPSDFPEAKGVTGDCTASTSLAANASCTLTVDFSPTGAGTQSNSVALSESVAVTTDTLNTNATKQTVTVTGTETQTKASSTAKVTGAPNPAAFDNPVTFTATVAAAAGGASAPVPTGTVTFNSQNALLGTGTLKGGTAKVATVNLELGTDSITATYSGDSNYNGSTSPVFIETVDALLTPAVTLSASSNPGLAGSAIKFTVAVTGGNGDPAVTGTVTFLAGTTTLGMGTLSKGVATLSTSKLTVGKHTITATYPGDTNYTEATSKALSESIDKVTPTVKLTSSLNPAAVAKGVTFKATVTGGAILPTGTVAFYAGTKQLGAATLSNGGASLSTSKLAAGKYDITAKYSGDSNDLIAESKALTETIDKLTPVVKLKSSTNPGTVGKAITFTATVTGGDGTPTGTVVFKSGTKTLGTATLSSGKAAYSTSKLAAGTYTITASYSGNADYVPVTSAALKETVDK
jgi:sugar lactone lactonase YvrE